MELAYNKVKINYENIQKNLIEIKKYNCNREIIAVVKNDAYNCGLEETVDCLSNVGVNFFATATLEEAIKIKQLNRSTSILILNPLDEIQFKEAYLNEFHILIYSLECIDEYYNYLKELAENNIQGGIKFHLKINVGMNRYGIKPSDIDKVLLMIKEKAMTNSKVVGLMSHFAQSEEQNLEVHNQQIENFAECYNTLKEKIDFDYIHCENSATFLQKNKALDFCNYSRVGILLFGYTPWDTTIKLLPAVYLQSKIININHLKQGDYIGYGTNKADKEMIIGVVPVGNGDGMPNTRKKFPVYINQKYYKIVGDISMSHMYVQIDENIKINDSVEIYGENIGFDYGKETLDTELMCMLKRN